MNLQIVAAELTNPVPVDYRDLAYEITDYLGGHGYTGGPADSAQAQAYIVDLLSPHGVIEPHYHDVDQYQIVVRGEGRIGRHTLRPGVIHYVDHHTTYGPIVAGPQGVGYFTLRPHIAGGRFDMPQSRALKTARSGGAFTAQADIGMPVSYLDISTIGETTRGAKAVVLRLPPGHALPDPAPGKVGYYLILAGSAVSAGGELSPRSCAFRGPGAVPLQGEAGDQGAVVVFVAFPSSAQEVAA